MRSPPHRRCPSAVAVVVVVTVLGGGVVGGGGRDPRAIPQPTPTARVAMYVDVVGVAYEVFRRTVVGRLMVGSGVVVLGYLVPSGLRWTVCSVCLVASTTTSEWMKGRGPCLGRLGS